MYGGGGANDLFLLVCRWCDKFPTPVAILSSLACFCRPSRLGCLWKNRQAPSCRRCALYFLTLEPYFQILGSFGITGFSSNHITPLCFLCKHTELQVYSLPHCDARKMELLSLLTIAVMIYGMTF